VPTSHASQSLRLAGEEKKLEVQSAIFQTLHKKMILQQLEDPLRKQLYEEKIKNNLISLEEGVRRLRKSYFAFHAIRSLIYKEIADTFKENEKCGLVEVGNYLLLGDPMLTISSWSENTEMILIS